ncbi:MAG: hypothetical protein ACI9BK_003518, partial [Acidimicrobiales bacterium]
MATCYVLGRALRLVLAELHQDVAEPFDAVEG